MKHMRQSTWVEAVTCVWDLKEKTERKLGHPVDARTPELIYGPAVAETLIRKPKHAQAMAKLMPVNDYIWQAFPAEGGEGSYDSVYNAGRSAGILAHSFADISGDRFVSVAARLPTLAQTICVLAHKLEPVPRQRFQTEFIADEAKRARVFNDDEVAMWHTHELQLGMGILSSIWHAKQIVPDLAPEEFAAALLRKYGIPIAVGEEQVYVCHWCRSAPCSCGGGKASHVVTWEDAAKNLHLGPLDTQKAMYYAYAWANIARGGVGYGPFRALIEATAEKGAVLVDEDSPAKLADRMGPLLLSQEQHFSEILERPVGQALKVRRAKLSELADAVHWQFLYAPGVCDHANGMQAAYQHVCTWLSA